MNDPFSDAIQRIVQAQRREEFAHSPQLALGRIIELLALAPDQSAEVVFVFEYAFPTKLASWRGAYSELALGFVLTIGHNAGIDHIPTVTEMLTKFRSAVGKTYQGWKGGDYVMSEETPVWVANPGNAGNTGIVGVTYRQYQVTLDTGWCEY